MVYAYLRRSLAHRRLETFDKGFWRRSTNRVPLAYELTAANAADVPLMLKVIYASVLVEPRASDDRCVEIGPR